MTEPGCDARPLAALMAITESLGGTMVIHKEYYDTVLEKIKKYMDDDGVPTAEVGFQDMGAAVMVVNLYSPTEVEAWNAGMAPVRRDDGTDSPTDPGA